MEPFLPLELLNEDLCLDDIIDWDEPDNLFFPLKLPQEVEFGNPSASYAEFSSLSANESAESESRKEPGNATYEAPDEAISEGVLQVVAATEISSQLTLINSTSSTSKNEENLQSSIEISTKDLLKMPKPYKMSSRLAVPEELKDEKYFEEKKKKAEMSRRFREKRKRLNIERITLLRESLEEIKVLKAKLEGYKDLERRYFQLEKKYNDSLHQNRCLDGQKKN